MIPVICPQCGLQVFVPPAVQGHWGLCFGCGARLRVPDGAAVLADNSITFQPGAHLGGRYEIIESIGQGGMAMVYSARDQLIHETVALKFIRPTLLQTLHGQQLFLREAQIARRLRHDNIVAVHDVSRTPEGVLYLSMEYLQGRSLRAYVKEQRIRRRYPPVRLVVRLMAQILDALAYAHRFVVHRDLKPENIMLLPGEWVKVLDFGLAKAIDEENVAVSASTEEQGRMSGTIAYAAPEQKRRHALDQRADLFTMGLILYEMLTLRTPLDRQPPISEARNDVAPSIEAVLHRARMEDPGMRWQTASEFRQALLSAFEESYGRAESLTADVSGESGCLASTEGMIYLEGGGFLMGADNDPAARPMSECNVEPYYMDLHPVTVAEYARFLDATGHPAPAYWDDPNYRGADQPVAGVSWDDAASYAAWAGKSLPTEDEWEFAARGKDNRLYPWGDREPDATLANYDDNVSIPTIVGMHEDGVTPDGLQDMAGNVYEWTADWYMSYTRRYEGKTGPEGPPRRVVRGGSWRTGSETLLCSHRKGLFPETRAADLGFRCVARRRL